MKRIVLAAAAAALTVGFSCAPIKGQAPRDTYVTNVRVSTNSPGHTFTVGVTCTLSYVNNNEVLPTEFAQVNPDVNDAFIHSFGTQNVVGCEAEETGTDGATTVKYGVPAVDAPPDTTNLSDEPQDCYYNAGGHGNTQTCYFYIENTFAP